MEQNVLILLLNVMNSLKAWLAQQSTITRDSILSQKGIFDILIYRNKPGV